MKRLVLIWGLLPTITVKKGNFSLTGVNQTGSR